MLTGERWFMIRELHQQGHSISAIARRLKMDRKTVRKALFTEGLPRYGPRAPRPSILDPYKPYLKVRLDQGITNAHRLLHEIRKQGYQGGYTILKEFVRPHRPVLIREMATVRFETEPGKQAQVDFGEFRAVDLSGKGHKLYLFLFTLGYSRAMFGMFVPSCQIEVFLLCHQRAFAYLGGVPKQGLYDNCKQVVLERDPSGNHHFHPRFMDFAGHYGLVPKLCRPARPQTKGKTERNIGYVRDAFFQGCAFEDLDDLNRQFITWLEEIANVRDHGTTRQRPVDRLQEESLTPFELFRSYDTSIISYRKASRECLVSYRGNCYSIPPEYAGMQVQLRHLPLSDHMDIYVQDQKIASHQICKDKGQKIIDAAHHRALWQTLFNRPPAPRGAPATLLKGTDGPQVEQRSLTVYEQIDHKGGI